MRACIHRGSREIGGSCVELEHEGQRLVLDLGTPLDSDFAKELPLPAVAGLATGDASLIGLLISHGHPDHYGLAHRVHPNVPLYTGEATARILREAAFFTTAGVDLHPRVFLRDREPLTLGPFQVTPFLADHSAFDAYSLLIDGGGRRLFYTGDLRAHGRKAGLFERLIANPPPGVDVLLIEGTHIRTHRVAPSATSEQELEAECARVFRETQGMMLVCYSAQNIDRLVTLYRAALRTGRDFVMDLYTATIAAATGRDSVPRAGSDRVRVFLPASQRHRVIEGHAFERTEAVRPYRIYPEELAARRDELVMTFRESMTRDLERAHCLVGAGLVWSLWPGYLDGESGVRLKQFCLRHEIPLVPLHASGHASVPDLRRLATAVNAGRVVPIHTAAPELYVEHFDRVERHSDGEWWAV
jgi:ribonuclease J